MLPDFLKKENLLNCITKASYCLQMNILNVFFPVGLIISFYLQTFSFLAFHPKFSLKGKRWYMNQLTSIASIIENVASM